MSPFIAGCSSFICVGWTAWKPGPSRGRRAAVEPFFSPDGQWLGFFANGKLKKVLESGGSLLTLANAPNPGGASWGSQNMIVFSPTQISALQQVPDGGGTPQTLTRLETGEVSHRWPEFLPGGKALLFAAGAGGGNWDNAQAAVQPVAGGERRNLGTGHVPSLCSLGTPGVRARGKPDGGAIRSRAANRHGQSSPRRRGRNAISKRGCRSI